jgi:hypothetical protein
MAQRFSSLEESQPRSEYWRDRSEDWESSGQTQADFCAERGLSLPAFRWWRWKLKQEGSGSTSSLVREEGNGMRLVPVRVVDAKAQSPTPVSSSVSGPPASAFEVLLESGTCIRVPGDFDAEALSRLLRTLEAVGC